MLDQPERIDRLYRLLPNVHAIRDKVQGEPLRALLQVIAEQVMLVEDDLEQLYDNWFIETCEDWVVPYIGDLIGEKPVHDAGQPGNEATEEARARNRILLPRREVANAIHNRRRKGTLALLELLARDVAGWPARAVEFYNYLAQGAAISGHNADRGRLVDVRSAELLSRLGSAFDSLARVPELRGINFERDQGRFNVPAVGLFVWRLRAYSITRAPASCIEQKGPHCYTFSILGNNVPLLNRPIAQDDPNAISGELNVSAFIGRQEFSQLIDIGGEKAPRASEKYYGLAAEPGSQVAQSVAIWAEGWPPYADSAAPIPAKHVIPADLSGWHYTPRNGQVAVDPVLGRIMFPPLQRPRKGVWVSYHYGFSADIGGGEYTRPLRQPKGAKVFPVKTNDELERTLRLWRQSDGGIPDQPEHAVIEIRNSGVYALQLRVFLLKGHTLQIRAAQRCRPVVRILDWNVDLPDSFVISGEEGSRFTIDGIMVAGRGLQVEGDLRTLTIRHTTLVPGWSLAPNCDPERPTEASIEIVDSRPCVVIEHSILGSIQVNDSEVQSDPITIRIADSIVDATGSDCDGPECEAIGASDLRLAHAVLRIVRSTVIGRVMTYAIELAENSIFTGCVTVARRQIGCVRFSYLPPHSRTPRRFNCQPDLAIRVAQAELPEGASQAGKDAVRDAEHSRVKPRFNSVRYGTPAYCQLAPTCASEITRGADDESEMGVFHDLFQPQRLANLRTRLDEYTPAATDVGIIFES